MGAIGADEVTTSLCVLLNLHRIPWQCLEWNQGFYLEILRRADMRLDSLHSEG